MIIINGRQYQPLTTKQRNDIYRQAFKTFLTVGYGPYLCNVVAELWREMTREYLSGHEIIHAFFPELAKRVKPVRFNAWPVSREWNAHRAGVLAQCIEETNAM